MPRAETRIVIDLDWTLSCRTRLTAEDVWSILSQRNLLVLDHHGDRPVLRGLAQVVTGLGHAGHDGLPDDVDLPAGG